MLFSLLAFGTALQDEQYIPGKSPIEELGVFSVLLGALSKWVTGISITEADLVVNTS